MKILIDAGHNSKNFDTGCVGKISKEQDLTFEIASALYKILRKNGYDAHLTRRTKDEILGTGTVNSSLAKRAEICNAINPDLFLSIHINSGGGTGCEAYVYEKGGASFDFAQKCVAEMQKIGRVSRGVKSAPFYVLKNTNAPAVLFEAGFIDNTAEEKWLCENTYAVGKRALRRRLPKDGLPYGNRGGGNFAKMPNYIRRGKMVQRHVERRGF